MQIMRQDNSDLIWEKLEVNLFYITEIGKHTWYIQNGHKYIQIMWLVLSDINPIHEKIQYAIIINSK